jgi:hypothetical protein
MNKRHEYARQHMEAPVTYQSLVFAEVRELLQGCAVSEVDGLYAVGSRSSVRAAILAGHRDTPTLHVSFGTPQPDLVDWQALRAMISGFSEVRRIETMPFACVVDANGQGHCTLPLAPSVALWELRVPQSSVPLVDTAGGGQGLPILRSRTGLAADSASPDALVWVPVVDYPNIVACPSEDARVTAFARYDGTRVVLTFEVNGECDKCAVEWAIGSGDRVDDCGVSPLTKRRGENGPLVSAEVPIDLPSSRQIYFELIT